MTASPVFAYYLHAVYFGRIRKSYYRFTDNYRDPSEEGPIPVQCDQTRYIGVYFRFWIAHSFHPRSADIWFEWTHSEVESANESLKHSHATDVDVGQPVLYWYEYLELSPELKVDGIMRLEATIEGHYIFSDWFELIGCNDDAKE